MISLRNIDRTKIKPVSREEHLARIKVFTDAQKRYEQVCKEMGIEPVPITC